MTKKQIILLSLLVSILCGGVYLYYNLSNILVRTTETIATNALGVNVDIGRIDVSLLDKQVVIKNIEIDNPEGYSNQKAMTVETVLIGLNMVNKEIIDFDDIEVKGSVVNLEVNQKGMNLVTLKKLANRTDEKPSKTDETIHVIVKRMVIEATTINPRITLIDRDLASIKMPPIKFNNIGSADGGSDAGEVISQILTKYIAAIQQEASQKGLLKGVSIPGVDQVGKALNNAKDTFKGLFQ